MPCTRTAPVHRRFPRAVPFGLADRCYLSDGEEQRKSHRHIEECAREGSAFSPGT